MAIVQVYSAPFSVGADLFRSTKTHLLTVHFPLVQILNKHRIASCLSSEHCGFLSHSARAERIEWYYSVTSTPPAMSMTNTESAAQCIGSLSKPESSPSPTTLLFSPLEADLAFSVPARETRSYIRHRYSNSSRAIGARILRPLGASRQRACHRTSTPCRIIARSLSQYTDKSHVQRRHHQRQK